MLLGCGSGSPGINWCCVVEVMEEAGVTKPTVINKQVAINGSNFFMEKIFNHECS
jgi:hypothetical protein